MKTSWLAILMIISACGEVRQEPDADPAACSIWDGTACATGDACSLYGAPAPFGAEDGRCDLAGSVALGAACNADPDPAERCVPGALCYEDAAFTKLCRAYCDPNAPNCAQGFSCAVDSLPGSDGSVGLCMPNGGAS